MSDADLDAKFLGLAEGVLPAAQARSADGPVLEGRQPPERRAGGCRGAGRMTWVWLGRGR